MVRGMKSLSIFIVEELVDTRVYRSKSRITIIAASSKSFHENKRWWNANLDRRRYRWLTNGSPSVACQRDTASQAFPSNLIIPETITRGNSRRAPHSSATRHPRFSICSRIGIRHCHECYGHETRRTTYRNSYLSLATIYQLINENRVSDIVFVK